MFFERNVSLNIGIDIDGVLTDIHGFNRKHAPPFFKKNFNREVVDDTPYDVRDIFECPSDEHDAYWRKHSITYAVFEPARKDASKTVRKLIAGGHNVYIISKRVFSCRDDFLGKLARFCVRNWMWWNGIKYKEIIFCDNDIPDSKRTACLDKGIDVMIDDEKVNIEAVAPVAKVICFDAPYNRDCEGENIIRAKNWDEVYRIISTL